MKTRELQGPHTVRVVCPVAWATADTESDFPAFQADHRLRITGARFIADTAITANATNHSVVAVKQGATVVASHAFDTPTTDDLAALGVRTLTLSATPADTVIEAGEVVAIDKTTPGTGVAVAGIIEIDYEVIGL